MIVAAVIAPVASTGPGVPDTALADHVPAGVRERREHDREGACDGPPTAVGMASRQHADSHQAEPESEQLAAGERLVREEAKAEDDREEGAHALC